VLFVAWRWPASRVIHDRAVTVADVLRDSGYSVNPEEWEEFAAAGVAMVYTGRGTATHRGWPYIAEGGLPPFVR
jgi:hypothetical protein